MFFLMFTIYEAIVSGLVTYDILTAIWRQEHSFIFFLMHFDVGFVLPLAVFAFVQTSLLAYSHFKQACFNVTTWELLRRDHISYMKDLPRGVFPFNRGILNNLEEFITMRKNKTEYDPPEIFVGSNNTENQRADSAGEESNGEIPYYRKIIKALEEYNKLEENTKKENVN